MEKLSTSHLIPPQTHNNRSWYVIGLSFMGLLLLIVILFQASQNPSRLLVGSWKELSWEYEKVNKNKSEKENLREISEEVKALIGQKLSIHQAETWLFRPNGDLLLKTKDGVKKLHWKLNGRGHVLELTDSNNKENYNITELNDSTLVINFDTDMEVRGIAKLTFAKRNYIHDIQVQ